MLFWKGEGLPTWTYTTGGVGSRVDEMILARVSSGFAGKKYGRTSKFTYQVRFGKKGKLAPRFLGPFEITERIGPVAYRLRLPEELNGVHDTFHVSNLKKCLDDPTLQVPLDEIQVDAKLNFVEEPVEILEREFKKLKRSRIAIVNHGVAMLTSNLLHVFTVILHNYPPFGNYDTSTGLKSNLRAHQRYVDLFESFSAVVVSWENLRTLHIEDAEIDQDLIKIIFSESPLLETLMLYSCYGFELIDSTNTSVKNLVFFGYDAPYIYFVEINALYIVSLTIEARIPLENLLLLNVSSVTEVELDYYKALFDDESLEMYDQLKEDMLKGLLLSQQYFPLVDNKSMS
ncbi:hypothetical protein Tco_0966182 [Tanacetum coccineum]